MSPLLTLIIQILLPIFGDIIVTYLLPLLNPVVRDQMSRILPIAERWVRAVETTTMTGAEKQVAAARQIIEQLKREGLESVEAKLVHQAIEMALVKIGAKNQVALPKGLKLAAVEVEDFSQA